jgi:hypothetical protein
MAKKRRKEKTEEVFEFKMPEFDEEEYIKKEVRDAKALFVTFGYAVVIAIASFGLSFVDIALAALLGFVAIVFLRHIYPLVGIDTTLLEKKQWGGNIIMYIFTWLAIWILLSNPPFSDFADPTIKDADIYFEEDFGNWTRYDSNVNNLTFGMNISINATIADNVKIDEESIKIKIERREGESFVEIESGDMNRIKKHRYAYQLHDIDQGLHRYTISAKDINGHEKSLSITFNVR